MNAITVADNAGLKPALASINESCRYMGGVSRAKFYADILPRLETVHIGRRHLVVIASMDRLIAAGSSVVASAMNQQERSPHAEGQRRDSENVLAGGFDDPENTTENQPNPAPLPDPSTDRSDGATDLDDLHHAHGLEAGVADYRGGAAAERAARLANRTRRSR